MMMPPTTETRTESAAEREGSTLDRVLQALRALDSADHRLLAQRRADIKAVLPEVRAAVAARSAPRAVRCLVPGGPLPDWRTALHELVALCRPFDRPGIVSLKGNSYVTGSLRFKEWVVAAAYLSGCKTPEGVPVPPDLAAGIVLARSRVVQYLLCQAAREGRLLADPSAPATKGVA